MADKNSIIIKRALFSCWRKPEAIELGKCLSSFNVELVASGGTADALESAGLKVERTDKFTGFADLLKGRVKTLHPALYAGILSRRDSQDDEMDLSKFSIKPFDLVVVDLYPFTDAGDKLKDPDTAVELIDVGGVSLIRAAAKNFDRVTVLCRSEQFSAFIELLKTNNGELALEQRRNYAAEGLRWTSYYDACIAGWLSNSNDALPDINCLPLKARLDLRYGENPHQSGRFYQLGSAKAEGVAAVEILGGKQLSFNNLLDLDIALRIPREFNVPTAAILKHTTPCGIGKGNSLQEAFINARSTDPTSAFGGIAGFNQIVDLETAKTLREGFMEVVVAPDYTAEALTELKKSKNLRIARLSNDIPVSGFDVRSLWGGVLIQEYDRGFPELDDLKIVTAKQPNSQIIESLKFAWIAVRYVKSNAILIADSKRTVGIGAGQMSRVDAAHLSIWKAKQSGIATEGCVAASDAFFPFRDGLDVLCDAGIVAVIQPGGSVRDEEVIEAANERGIIMIFTGRRHFRH